MTYEYKPHESNTAERKEAPLKITPGEPMPKPLKVGLGENLESIGHILIWLMIFAGVMAVFTLGKTTVFEGRLFGEPYTSTKWDIPAVIVIIVSTLWSAAVAWAISRIGTCLRWLETIGTKAGIEAEK